MSIGRSFGAVAALFLVMSSPSQAAGRWIYGETEDSLDDTLMRRVLITNADGYALGARCVEPSDLEVMLIARDKSMAGPGAQGLVVLMNEIGVGLRLRADKADPVDYPAKGDVPDETVLIVSAGPEAFAPFKSAKKRIVVAVKMVGADELVHKTSFDLPSDDSDLKKFRAHCAP